jgi:hypothetical protein
MKYGKKRETRWQMIDRADWASSCWEEVEAARSGLSAATMSEVGSWFYSNPRWKNSCCDLTTKKRTQSMWQGTGNKQHTRDLRRFFIIDNARERKCLGLYTVLWRVCRDMVIDLAGECLRGENTRGSWRKWVATLTVCQ